MLRNAAILPLWLALLLVGETAYALSTGQPVSGNDYLAVGTVEAQGRSCTGALFSDRFVLTAAGCFCNEAAAACVQRANFQLGGSVHPGTARRHPDHQFVKGGFDNAINIGVLELDTPLNSVPSMSLGTSQPAVGNQLILVGFGETGTNCAQPSTGKRQVNLEVDRAFDWQLRFKQLPGACPGDLGGPVLDSKGHIVGLLAESAPLSRYAVPTFPFIDWIRGSPDYSGWGSCQVVSVGAQLSLAPAGPWCPPGTFLTRFDLDTDASLSAHESPIVGHAECCSVRGFENYAKTIDQYDDFYCSYEPDSSGREKPLIGHQPEPEWCWTNNNYLTGVDMVAAQRFVARDSPVVESVYCCSLSPNFRDSVDNVLVDAEANKCEWIAVGVERSHQSLEGHAQWCPDGKFLRQFDLDQFEPNKLPSPHDAPIVGRALCCR